jgi:hypothetical protein
MKKGKKGKSVYLKQSDLLLVSVALDFLSKWHQEMYNEECTLHENDKHNINEHHLECSVEIRDLREKFKA